MSNPIRIMVAPLNWGLGHASRSCAIIDALQEKGVEVIPAADGAALDLLRSEYPRLNTVEFPDLDIRYPKRGSIKLALFRKWRDFQKLVKAERETTARLKKELGLDAIISDNRYGVYSQNAPSILVTHQLNPPVFLGTRTVKKLSRNFHRIWIPDEPGERSIAGKLAEVPRELSDKSVHIGWLSRLEGSGKEPSPNRLLLLLSGPEGRRTQLEELLIRKASVLRHDVSMIRGTRRNRLSAATPPGWRIIDMASREQMQDELEQAEFVVCRAGYSSLMDLTVMKKKAIVVPTPGQDEQLYLARHMETKGFFKYRPQNEMHLAEELEGLEHYSPPTAGDSEKLNNAIESLLNSLR